MYAYDTKIIKKRIREMKQKSFSPEDITIYFDMDNTLCLFSIYQNEEQAVEAMFKKNFYRNLPIFPEAYDVIATLKRMGFQVKILSACINNAYCRKEKLEWLHYHLPMIHSTDIILCDVGENKASFIQDIHKSVLVDDFGKNIDSFYQAGGIGIKKTYSGKKRPVPQIQSLVEIFAVLREVGIQ